VTKIYLDYEEYWTPVLQKPSLYDGGKVSGYPLMVTNTELEELNHANIVFNKYMDLCCKYYARAEKQGYVTEETPESLRINELLVDKRGLTTALGNTRKKLDALEIEHARVGMAYGKLLRDG